MGSETGEPSAAVRPRVAAARERQLARLRGLRARSNGEMSGAQARRFAALTREAERELGRAVDRYGLTGRGFDRLLKVSRTVADLAESEVVEGPHVLEALSFRGEEPVPESGVA